MNIKNLLRIKDFVGADIGEGDFAVSSLIMGWYRYKISRRAIFLISEIPTQKNPKKSNQGCVEKS